MFNMLAQEAGSVWSWIIPLAGALAAIGVVGTILALVRKLVVEVKELLVAVVNILTPGGVTVENIKKVIKEAKDIPLALKELVDGVKKDKP